MRYCTGEAEAVSTSRRSLITISGNKKKYKKMQNQLEHELLQQQQLWEEQLQDEVYVQYLQQQLQVEVCLLFLQHLKEEVHLQEEVLLQCLQHNMQTEVHMLFTHELREKWQQLQHDVQQQEQAREQRFKDRMYLKFIISLFLYFRLIVIMVENSVISEHPEVLIVSTLGLVFCYGMLFKLHKTIFSLF
ncbi:hypothetical protein R6Q59_009480 [Mikania micrantha]